jgi:hypothetical protein
MGKKEKPLSYYAKYLGGHPRYPGDEDIGVYIHPTLLELAFKGHSIMIPYSDIKNISNDKSKVFEGFAMVAGIGLLMNRNVNATVIIYDNDKETSETQAVALDFWSNERYAQPIIYDRMMAARNAAATQLQSAATTSTAAAADAKPTSRGPISF